MAADRLEPAPGSVPGPTDPAGPSEDGAPERLRRLEGGGPEARLQPQDHTALRLWLRLLACSTQIEAEIRRRLRERFGISLSRFDYLAQLHRADPGLRMSELSRRLMVTGGNVTALTDELTTEGLVERRADPADRRAATVALTPAGRRQFERMAHEHEAWVVQLLGGLAPGEQRELLMRLGTLRLSLSEPAAVAAVVAVPPPEAVPLPIPAPIPAPIPSQARSPVRSPAAPATPTGAGEPPGPPRPR